MPIGHRVAEAKARKAALTDAEHQMHTDLTDVTNDEIAEQLMAEDEANPPQAPQASLPMDQVLALLKATQGSQGISAQDLETILTKVVSSGATAQTHAMQTALNRSNPNYVPKSPYHYEDGREAIPKYIVRFGPQYTKSTPPAMPKDMWSSAECDLINAFTVGERKEARQGSWTAECRRDGSTEELVVKVPMGTMDQRADLPSFAMILQELLGGEVAVSPAKLVEEVAELKRKLAALTAA